MATKGQRRRHRRRHTCKPRRASRSELIPSGPTSVHHIPDHLLELVLLRVGSSLSLLRAAFTCKRWRHIIADTAFLSRILSLHAPHVAGHYHVIDPSHDDLPLDGNNQVFVPDTSTADALDRRQFSLDFLPDLDWEVGDSRGGLLLLYRRNIKWYLMQDELYFPDMIVCDPLARRYQGILHLEEMHSSVCLGLFLLDGVAVDETGGDCIGMSNFRVVVVVYKSNDFEDGQGAPTPGACVCSNGGWQVESAIGNSVAIPECHLICFVGRAGLSLYWRMEREDVVLALDETTLKFSLVKFPYTVVGMPDESSTFRVIGGHDVDDAEVRVVRIINNSDLTVFAEVKGSSEWVVEKLVRRPAGCRGSRRRTSSDQQRLSRRIPATSSLRR